MGATQRGIVFGWDAESHWVNGERTTRGKGVEGTALFFGGAIDGGYSFSEWDLPPWQLQRLKEGQHDLIKVDGREGPLWLVSLADRATNRPGGIPGSDYQASRDRMGKLLTHLRSMPMAQLDVRFVDCSGDQVRGAVAGLEMASYQYRQARSERTKGLPLPHLNFHGARKNHLQQGAHLGSAVNLARQLVNVPADQLDPESYAKLVQRMFTGRRHWKVDVWNEAQLAKARCRLILAVGAAARKRPRLVHLSYRPSSSKRQKRPVAFVGKGITFDSGGLDLKSHAGMRLMKKDMGGSAALVGYAHWLAQTEASFPCDIYLALAENGISGDAVRPGDVVTSRAGKTVEIHNTDAEGRLVLADAMDVALTQSKVKPRALIDVATLTGAVKVGLGADVAGLFSNDERLTRHIVDASVQFGDACWPMPLVRSYQRKLESKSADMTNSAATPFGGAITAALFLEGFAQSVPWAHLDIYAWSDRAHGALAESGASGQAVQLLCGMSQHL